MSDRVFSARIVVPEPGVVLVGGGVVVDARGLVRRVLANAGAGSRAARDGRARGLGGGVLTAGLVCAHAHLELTALEGRVPAGGDFVDWIGALLRARGELSREEARAGLERGARALLASGTTTVGDIDSLGLPRPPSAKAPTTVGGMRCSRNSTVLCGPGRAV